MTLALAKHLVQFGRVSAAEMDDVLQRQVIFGGSIGTNLLELDLVAETELMEALGQIHGLHVAHADLLVSRDVRVPKLFPARLAQKYQVVPVSMSGRSLIVLSASRIHPRVVDEINFMLSLSVKTYLVCEARLQILMHQWIGVEIGPRYLELAAKLGPFPGTESAPVTPDRAPEELAAQEALADSRQSTEAGLPARVELALSGIVQAEQAERERRERSRRGKISLAQATDVCMRAADRDEMVDTVLRFTRQFVDYVGLFVINNEVIFGWDAVGHPGAAEQIRKVRLATSSSSVLSTVVKTRATYLGPVPGSGNNNDLLRAMGRSGPRNVLIVPIPVQDRLVALVYADAGARSIRGGRIQELLVFLSRLPAAFEQLIRQIKGAAHQDDRVVEAQEPKLASAQFMAEDAAMRAAGLLPRHPEAEPEPEPEPEPAKPAAPISVFSAAPVLETGAASGAAQTLAPDTEEELPEEEPPEEEPPEEEPDPEEKPPDAEPGQSGLEAIDFQTLAPAVTPSKIDFPAVSAEDLRPGEQPVRFESLEDEAAPADGVTVVDTDSDVVVVDAESGFAPEPEQAPVAVPVIGSLQVVELDPGLELAASSGTAETVVAAEPEAAEPETAEPAAEPETAESWVEHLVAEDDRIASQARQQLASLGPSVLPAVMERFPGRLRFDPYRSHDAIPPVAEHGELLALLLNLGTQACEAVVAKLEDSDAQVRYYAVLLLGELGCERVVSRLAGRLYDRDAKVRMTTIDSLASYRGSPGYESIMQGLRNRLSGEDADQQAIAAALLGNFKDRSSLALLIGLLKSKNRMVVRAAVESLSYITKQDFGTSERRWMRWWRQHKGESRVKWLIVGLRSKSRDVRFSSAQELSAITKEYFGYYFDSSKADREKAIRRWELWWEEAGRRLRFE